jgi:hypothetical protein
VSLLHYEVYSDVKEVEKSLAATDDIQCIVGRGYIPFGKAQKPALTITQIRPIHCNSYVICDGSELILSLIYEDFSKLIVKLN